MMAITNLILEKFMQLNGSNPIIVGAIENK
jgi:hypothetical protein